MDFGKRSRAEALTAQVKTLDKKLAQAGPVNPHAQIQVRTGVDPAMTPCVNDAKVDIRPAPEGDPICT